MLSNKHRFYIALAMLKGLENLSGLVCIEDIKDEDIDKVFELMKMVLKDFLKILVTYENGEKSSDMKKTVVYKLLEEAFKQEGE